jgi:uncharacterized protein YukE
MADGPPFPHSVAFDHGRASKLVGELSATIVKLRQQAGDRHANGARMLQNWKGPYAREFEGELTRMERQAGDLIGAMQAMVKTVSAASQEATALQRQRDAANQKWWDSQPDPGIVPGL